MPRAAQLIAYRPEAIWDARRAFFDEGRESAVQVGDVVLRSWRRCAGRGRGVNDAVAFEAVDRPMLQRLIERNRALLQIAQPELGSLARAVSDAGYAVLLTDANAQVLAVDGAIAPHSAPLRHAFRAGVDLSEASIGTNAMAVAMCEQQAVSVCGPEHFFSDVQIFHCCAAPVFGPQGDVIGAVDVSHDRPGMLRSALWLAGRCAQRIERRLFQAVPSFLRLEIDVDEGFHGDSGTSTQAWLALDGDGCLVAASHAARQLMGLPPQLSGLAFSELFEARFGPWVCGLRAGSGAGALLPLKGGLRLRAQVMGGAGPAGASASPVPASPPALQRQPALAGASQAPVYGDERLSRALGQARRALGAGLTVLLTGETGTGKDVTARALHAASAHASGPFVAINCAAIPSELLAGELFGHVDGAYTGSRRGGAAGKIEAAHGGTLFLDEIGDMPLALQAALLRVLDNREVVRLGDSQPRQIDLQIVCATHCDLSTAVAEGRFREDLFYRVAGHAMHLLPLREREDFDAVLDALLRQSGSDPERLGAAMRGRLRAARWPGNVRQLSHVLKRALALSAADGALSESDFDLPASLPPVPPHARQTPLAPPAVGQLRAAQDRAIAQALQETGGKVTEAARRLGMGRATLYRRLKTSR